MREVELADGTVIEFDDYERPEVMQAVLQDYSRFSSNQGPYQHQTYKNPFDGTSEAFAQGVYEAPGQLGGVFDAFSPWASLYKAFSGSSIQDRIDRLTGANELGYDPADYDGVDWLQSLARLGGNVVGDPLNAIPAGMVGHAGIKAYGDLIDDTPGLFGEAGSVSNFINDYITSAKARGVNPKTEIVDDLFIYSDLPEAQQLAIDRIKSGDIPLGLTGKGRSQRGSIGDLPMDEASRMQRARDSRLLPIPASLIGLNYLKDYEDSL